MSLEHQDHEQATEPRIAVLHALPDEARFLGEEYRPLCITNTGVAQKDPAPANGPGMIAWSVCVGVGADSAYRKTSLLLRQYPRLRGVIVIGFAGGLAGSVLAGSLVVAESVTDAVTQTLYRPGTTLMAAAQRALSPPTPVHYGAIITTDRVIVTGAAKKSFARGTAAIAVDMESAAVAHAATENGIPWLAVRVITDGLDDDLPLDFNALADPDGSVNRGRIVAETLRRPWKIPALIRLGQRSSRGARNLAAFLHPLLRQIPPS